MSFLKTGALSVAFMVAADVALAGGMGMVGIHSFVVEGGASLGEALNIPQIDWTHLWEEWELQTINPETDPCLSTGGHYHGDFCHYGPDGPSDQIAQLPPNSGTPAPQIDNNFD